MKWKRKKKVVTVIRNTTIELSQQLDEGSPAADGPEESPEPAPESKEASKELPPPSEAAAKVEPEEAKDPTAKQDKIARKTFITDKEAGEAKVEAGEYKLPFTLHDLLIPGGKPAKLAKIPDVSVSDLRLPEILFRFKFRDPTPVILLIGGRGARA